MDFDNRILEWGTSIIRLVGTFPTLGAGTNLGAGLLSGGNLSSLNVGQLDAPTFFNFIMITLVELGAVFWVGAQLWITFVLQPSAEDHADLSSTNSLVKQRFDRFFSLPTLVVLFLANIGVIAQAIAPSLFVGQATTVHFGTFWIMREGVIAVALILALYMLLFKSRSRIVNTLLPWVNLGLGLALLIAIAMSGQASTLNNNIVVYAIVLDWLHLLAAALWIGGMMFIATTYLPVLRKHPIMERVHSLVTVLPYFSPWALTGVFIMAVTGPFNADFHLTSWAQFFTTAYGRTLTVKILLVGGLLLTSAIHIGVLRPRLKKEYKKYNHAIERLRSHQAGMSMVGAGLPAALEQVTGRLQAHEATMAVPDPSVVERQVGDYKDEDRPHIVSISGSRATTVEPDRATKLIAQHVKLREGRVAKGTQRLMQVLRWEPLLGVGVLICVGLMNVFVGTLSLAGATPQQPSQTTGQSKPFEATVKTSDNKFLVTLNVNPDRFGTNVFTVTVVDSKTNKAITNIGVALYTTMLDMDMGTQNVNLLPDGKGHFSASGDLDMEGNWEIRIQIRTIDNTLHEATVKLLTPF